MANYRFDTRKFGEYCDASHIEIRADFKRQLYRRLIADAYFVKHPRKPVVMTVWRDADITFLEQASNDKQLDIRCVGHHPARYAVAAGEVYRVIDEEYILDLMQKTLDEDDSNP